MARLIAVEDLAGPSVLGRGGHAMHVLQILEGLGHDVLAGALALAGIPRGTRV